MADHSTTPEKKPMAYARLGNSGLKVSKIILGCATYGDPRWQKWLLGESEGLEHIKAAYDMGIQTFDTSNVYSNGTSETILGKAIKKFNLPREELVILTKVFFAVAKDPSVQVFFDGKEADDNGYVNQHGLSRKHIFDSVKASLKRLQLDYVDILLCHRFDNDTPIEETMKALHDVVQAGYARYIGMSSCHAWQFHVMQNYAITHNLTPFICMQNHYNLVYREEEREMFPTLKHFGVGSIPWSPLARGFVTRPLGEQTNRSESDRMIGTFRSNEGSKQISARVEELAKKKGVSMAQLSCAWVMQRDGVSAPVVGSTSVKNIQDLVAAIHIKLSDEEKQYLEEPYQPMALMGHT